MKRQSAASGLDRPPGRRKSTVSTGAERSSNLVNSIIYSPAFTILNSRSTSFANNFTVDIVYTLRRCSGHSILVLVVVIVVVSVVVVVVA